MGLWGPRTTFLVTSFTEKMPESLDSIYSSSLMLENMILLFYLKQMEFTRNLFKFVNLFKFSSGPLGPTIGTKFTISSEFGPFQVKL